MSALTEALGRVRSVLTGQASSDDPLVDALLRKSVGTGLTLGVIVVVWLVLVNVVSSQLILGSATTRPGTDLVLQAASESIDEVVKFANSTEPIAAEISPQEAYPAAIAVAPLEVARNPFAPLPVPPSTGPDLGELIRQKQEAAIPIAIRAIVSQGDTHLAVLASDAATRVVRAGDTFMDWRVLAVGRDRVLLKKDGKTRTIVWEGSK